LIDDTSRFEKSARCPKCGNYLFRVIESRNINGVKRRRRACKDLGCGHRETTYEVSSADYQFLKKARAVERIFSSGGENASKKQLTCQESCALWKNGACEFDFPEAGGRFAEECTLFEQR
jgi:hypothetical protein